MDKKVKVLKTIFYLIMVIVVGLIVRIAFIDKEVSIAIACETDIVIPDLTVKLNDEIIFNDTIYLSPIPCCWVNKKLDLGYNTITVESKTNNIKKEFKVIGFKDIHVYTAVWKNNTDKLFIEEEVFYFLRPLYV